MAMGFWNGQNERVTDQILAILQMQTFPSSNIGGEGRTVDSGTGCITPSLAVSLLDRRASNPSSFSCISATFLYNEISKTLPNEAG